MRGHFANFLLMGMISTSLLAMAEKHDSKTKSKNQEHFFECLGLKNNKGFQAVLKTIGDKIFFYDKSQVAVLCLGKTPKHFVPGWNSTSAKSQLNSNQNLRELPCAFQNKRIDIYVTEALLATGQGFLSAQNPTLSSQSAASGLLFYCSVI